MKHVALYGELGRKFGKHWKLDVGSPQEALRAINANKPGFFDYLADCERRKQRFRVFIGCEEVLASKDLTLPMSSREYIRIVPVTEGSGGLLSAAAGIALMIFAPEAAALFAISEATVTSIAAGMILSGLSSLLVDTPKTQRQEAPDNKPSYSFNGAENVVTQGGCVPVAYGQVEVGSTIVSSGIYTTDIDLSA